MREKLLKARFHERRRQVMRIYQNWSVDVNNEKFTVQQDAVLVSRQALSAWLLQHRGKVASVLATDKSNEQSERTKRTRLDDITCEHGAVDPNKSKDIKRLNRAAYLDMVKDTGWDFEPHFSIADICVEIERLYQIEHPRSVSRFDRISEVAFGNTGFWISKPWIRDWRLSKPRMHVTSEGDPAPDAGVFASDVLCEHGGLSLNTTSRRSISTEAVELLQELFPSWKPLSTDAESCPVCDASIHISKENKREMRKQAEEEKAKLKTLQELLSQESGILEDVPCALIPHEFANSWRKWLDRPTDYPRPEKIDTTSLACEHSLLVFDPNVPSDLEVAGIVVPRSIWDILQTLKTDWVTTQIIIRLSCTERNKTPAASVSKKPATYSRFGHRQSRRLRQVQELGEKRRFTISKSTTIKDIKVTIQEGLKIPTICQRLFYCNKELDNNMATVESIGIMADDILDLRREDEVVDLNTGSEDDKRPRDLEERGFYGTLLGRSDSIEGPPTSSPPDIDEKKSCSACTFLNEGDAVNCTICDTLFA
ncbi:hypothetical protein H0H92_000053 [Tricholoma furcatifolium]|nr:hypothetical protein H0H92_000053 [Tricholoma furcatifolium]